MSLRRLPSGNDGYEDGQLHPMWHARERLRVRAHQAGGEGAPRRLKKDTRHRAREAALQILYQWEVGRAEVSLAAETYFTHQWPQREAPPDDLVAFATSLARDTVDRLDAIDPLIASTTERWRPERMAVVDRLIMRLATCELLRDRGTPPAVVINEALELARTFSTGDSVRFINGILDAIRKKIDGSR
jgi:N utilization substance protein B